MLNRREWMSLAGRAAPPPGYWLHASRSAMACRFEVTVPAEDRSALAAARQALQEIDRLEDQLTVFRDSSEVSFINRTAAERPVAVEPRLFDLLQLSARLYQETGGAFDITTAPLTRCWGFYRRRGRIPDRSELEEARACVGMHRVELDSAAGTVRFLRAGVEINLGSIGKGYALDRVAGGIKQRGVRTALLSGGSSSVLALGDAFSGRGWLVGLRDPRRRNARLASLRLRDCALATSGCGEQYFQVDGKRYGHIIDPRTGTPTEGISTVTVAAPTAAEADALATAFYVGGPELAQDYCALHTEVLAVVLPGDLPEPFVIGASSRCKVQVTE